MNRYGLLLLWSASLCACGSSSPGGGSTDAGDPGGDAATDAAVDGSPVDPGIESSGGSMRFDLVSPMCTAELFDSGAGCPSDDDKCLCKPEFDSLNPARGSAGNPDGRVIILAQPRYGRHEDGSYAFDAYAAVKEKGNFVGHYVNELNPTLTCTLQEAWTPDKGCADPGMGCGWRCVDGADWADQLVDKEIEAYRPYASPELIALNEAWSTLFAETDVGIQYRTWLRDVTRQLVARGRLPLLYVHHGSTASGPFTLLSEISQYALIGVEAYLSGREILDAPGMCAAPYDSTNWCYKRYVEFRAGVRNSAQPAIPLDRLIMLEHFGNNLYKYTDAHGNKATSSWGRAYDNDSNSPTFGLPTTSFWDLAIERRARAMKALPGLGGVSSYCFACNGSGTGSGYRVQFNKTWAGIALP